MFGLIVPGRAVQPAPTQAISATQYAFAIPAAPPFSHLAVFLLPGHALPPDALAAIYIKLGADFRLLGALANDKQSAVFRLGAASSSTGSTPAVREEIMLDDATGEPLAEPPAGEIVVGVSVEPAAQVHAQLEGMRATKEQQQQQQQQLVVARPAAASPAVLKDAARRIGRNAYDFLSGFAQGAPGQEAVPLRSLQDWWAKFEKKVDMDVGFLMRDEA